MILENVIWNSGTVVHHRPPRRRNGEDEDALLVSLEKKEAKQF